MTSSDTKQTELIINDHELFNTSYYIWLCIYIYIYIYIYYIQFQSVQFTEGFLWFGDRRFTWQKYDTRLWDIGWNVCKYNGSSFIISIYLKISAHIIFFRTKFSHDFILFCWSYSFDYFPEWWFVAANVDW